MGGRVMFQFIFKCFPVERYRIQLDWYWAMLTLAMRLQLFRFAFRFPLTISTCWTADCVWIAAHGHCMCVCYCRYMTPSQLLLEDARVFPFGWTEKKKIPLQPKIRLPIIIIIIWGFFFNLFHNQPYTTNVSHLISINVSQSALSFHLHTLTVCVSPHTLLHTSSVPNHKFKQKTKKQKTILSKCAADIYLFFSFSNGGCWVGSQQ